MPAVARAGGESEAVSRPCAAERLLSLFALVPVCVLGLCMKEGAGGSAASWSQAYGAGVVYEVFWLLVLRVVWPQAAVGPQAAGVFGATALVELSQLWHPPVLEAARRTFLGHAFLGASFDWIDYPHYAVGCGLGAVLAICIRRLACGCLPATVRKAPPGEE